MGPIERLQNEPDYDPGLLNDFGGGDVNWWENYIRYEVNAANDWWRSRIEAEATADCETRPAADLDAYLEAEREAARCHLMYLDFVGKYVVTERSIDFKYSSAFLPVYRVKHEKYMGTGRWFIAFWRFRVDIGPVVKY
jgi:hypothetical protein